MWRSQLMQPTIVLRLEALKIQVVEQRQQRWAAGLKQIQVPDKNFYEHLIIINNNNPI